MYGCFVEAITILSRIGWEHLRAHKPIFRAELMSLCGSNATTKLGPDNAAHNNTLLPNKEILIQGHLIFDKLNVMGISFSLYFFFNSVLYAPNWRGRCNRPRGLTGETDGAGGATCVRPNMTAPKPLCINCLFGSFFYGRRKQVWGRLHVLPILLPRITRGKATKMNEPREILHVVSFYIRLFVCFCWFFALHSL